MRTLTLLLAAAGTLTATPVIGLNFPAGTEPEIPDGPPAIRYVATASSLTDGAADRIGKAAQKSGTGIVAALGNNTGGAESWRQLFVGAMATSYGKAVTHWEILPPADLDPRMRNSAYEYAQALTLARKAAREVTPESPVGISIARYDLQFLDACLRDGAAGQFDFVSLAPFPASPGTERLMPGALDAVRKLLAQHGLPSGTPVHITFTGAAADLVMAAASARAAGFDRVFIEADAETLAGIPDKTHADIPATRADATVVSITLGETNKVDGIEQILPDDTPWDPELKAKRMRVSANQPVNRTGFLADPSFTGAESGAYEITVTAKRLPSEDGLLNPTAVALTYEGVHGLHTASTWAVPGGDEWHSHTWQISDAHFKGRLGWHFLLDASGAGIDVLIREVKLAKAPGR